MSYVDPSASEFMVLVDDRVKMRNHSLRRSQIFAFKMRVLGHKASIIGFHQMVES